MVTQQIAYSLALVFVLATATTAFAYGDETTEIKVTPIGEAVIDLDSSNRLFRANIQVINFDPRDGIYNMQVTQLTTQKIVSSGEIFVRDLPNGLWGTQVAYLLDENELSKDGEEITGEYEIQIKTEFGTAIGKTNFSVIKSSESKSETDVENVIDKEFLSHDNEEQIVLLTLETESEKVVETNQELELDVTTDTQSEIPEWVRNIFIWYAEGSISEGELLDSIKVLIQQGIIIA